MTWWVLCTRWFRDRPSCCFIHSHGESFIGAKAQFQTTVKAKEESGGKAASFEEGDLKVAHAFTLKLYWLPLVTWLHLAAREAGSPIPAEVQNCVSKGRRPNTVGGTKSVGGMEGRITRLCCNQPHKALYCLSSSVLICLHWIYALYFFFYILLSSPPKV